MQKERGLFNPQNLCTMMYMPPMNVSARGGYDYYVTFIDNYYWYNYLQLMHCKSEYFDKFQEYRVEVEKQLGLHVKTLRLD